MTMTPNIMIGYTGDVTALPDKNARATSWNWSLSLALGLANR